MLDLTKHTCPSCGSFFIKTKLPEGKSIKEQELKFECLLCPHDWVVRKPVWLERRIREMDINSNGKVGEIKK